MSAPKRILITGGPRTGKTTLSEECATWPEHVATVLHTDDLIGKLDWSAASAEVATWFDKPAPWIIEGVSIPRALRKWLLNHPELTSKPADVIYWLDQPITELTPGQVTMTKGCLTVWQEILPELTRRNIAIVVGYAVMGRHGRFAARGNQSDKQQ